MIISESNSCPATALSCHWQVAPVPVFLRTMLARLTRRLRRHAAIVLATLYALCVIGPVAALALSHSAAHCLTEPGAAHVHGKASAQSHGHTDDVSHQHDDGDTGHEHSGTGTAAPGNCCGLFCVTALAHEPGFAPLTPPAIGPVTLARADALDGRGPDRIDRPPSI